MIKVWIAGSNGQIGRALNDILDPLEIEVLNTDLDDLDITNTEEVLNFGIVLLRTMRWERSYKILI